MRAVKGTDGKWEHIALEVAGESREPIPLPLLQEIYARPKIANILPVASPSTNAPAHHAQRPSLSPEEQKKLLEDALDRRQKQLEAMAAAQVKNFSLNLIEEDLLKESIEMRAKALAEQAHKKEQQQKQQPPQQK